MLYSEAIMLPYIEDLYAEEEEKVRRDLNFSTKHSSIMEIFGPKYLRRSTITDIGKLYTHHKEKHRSESIHFAGGCCIRRLIDMTCFLWYWWVEQQHQRIYLEWVPFVKSVSDLAKDDYKRLRYKRMYEGARKDVEWTFGVLKNK
ncbi:RNA-directed DNA polymerase, eukaryota, reverse transcriptase zinc-binding domain protein [Tanacetum coccineum]